MVLFASWYRVQGDDIMEEWMLEICCIRCLAEEIFKLWEQPPCAGIGSTFSTLITKVDFKRYYVKIRRRYILLARCCQSLA